MGFKVEIKNIGKLSDTKIQIGDFTVLAGPNNTGKSSVSKILYSLFDAANANYAESYLRRLVNPVRRAAQRLRYRRMPDKGKSISDLSFRLIRIIRRMESLVETFSIEESKELLHPLLDHAEKIRDIAQDILNSPSASVSERLQNDLTSSVNKMEHGLAELSDILSDQDLDRFISIGMKHQIEENLIQNFQIPNIETLQSQRDVPSEIDIEEFGVYKFNEDKRDFRPNRSLVEQSWLHSRVIYLESPVYWKLKEALESVVGPRGSFFGRELLSGVPGYFYDLARALKSEYSGDVAFPDVYEQLTGQEAIGGKIAITEDGDLSFQEDGRSFSLPVTAMGIANLGILALLIERKILDEDAFLFIDEPEAHLHPAWQIIIAEALFKLCLQGVRVIIATHSIDILKWLEVYIKNNPDKQKLVALNHFSTEVPHTEDNFLTKMAKIKRELTEPFSHLYLKGL